MAALLLSIKIKPGSKQPGIQKDDATHWTVRVREPATEGKANAALLKAVAGELGVAPSRVKLVRGQKSKEKTLEILD